MNKLLMPLALVALLLSILPALLLLGGAIDLETTKLIMLISMIVWYGAATPWLGLSKDN